MKQSISQKIKNTTLVFLFSKLWKFGVGGRKNIVIYTLMFVIANVVLLATPLIFKEFIDEIQRNGLGPHNINYLFLLLLALLGITLIFWFLHGPARMIQKKHAFRIRNNYREYLVSKTLNFDVSWHSDKDSGDSIDKINKATEGLYKFGVKNNRVSSMSVKIFGTTIALMFFNIYVGLLAFVILAIALFVTFLFDVKLVPKYRHLNKFQNKISAKVFDIFSNITSVKILGIEKISLKNLKRHFWNPFSLYKKTHILMEWKWFVGQVLFTSIIVFPIMLYVLFISKGNLLVEVGTLSAMYIYLSKLREVYMQFASLYEEMMIHKAQVDNAHEIEYAINRDTADLIDYPETWQSLHVSKLHFMYKDADVCSDPHLDGINVDIQRGQKIACIGHSGSGKTTFLKVVHGLYDNASSHVSFDGGDVLETNFSNIDLQTTLVPQEPELFSSSIRENVTFGLEYSDDDINRMLSLAEFTDVVESLPKGLDTIINEKGVNLSGGQKQRLALARALLFSQDKDIILLDESTSSVDPTSEVNIYKNIFSEFSGKTFIASIHKMNLLKYFDTIIIFDKGNISDSGSFQDLYSRNTDFKKQWDEYVQEEHLID